MTEKGYGMQIVQANRGQNNTTIFELNESELAKLLLREDVADRPVVVVSIAGPFRGGKSFLLDFFLRYLKASRSKQLSGEWLGDENEPLKGFHWRGGCDRDTIGIHCWSEPFHITLQPSGEEVVVLLMDTQGSFDAKSTLRDSTIIFALSTLLSSKQLYNLFRNIDESDLQHLQLFTDYGSKIGGKAFQELQFLVRDWQSAFQYPYGYKGGSTFLAEKLKIDPKQKSEVGEVREHINQCFEKVSCFLMPHPGLDVGEESFKGCLCDITQKFKRSLLELVPALFDPQNLQPKMIGGQKVKSRELMLYLREYIKIFGMDTMPPVTSILRGTAAAGIMATTNAARKEYDAYMKPLEDEVVSFSTTTVRTKHETARNAAIQLFNGRKLIGTKSDVEKAFNRLNKDLDNFLRAFQYNNDIKLRRCIETTKRLYNDTMGTLYGANLPQLVCVHPADLEQFHDTAMAAALEKFDSFRKMEGNETDEEKPKIQQNIISAYEHLCTLNAKNNDSAVEESHTLYLSTMSAHHGYVDPAELSESHEAAVNDAKVYFAGMRTKPTQQETDSYEAKLMEEISKDYLEIEQRNFNPNKTLVHQAMQSYNELMDRKWHPRDGCFSVPDFHGLHNDAKAAALNVFEKNCVAYDKEMYLEQLNSAMQSRCEEQFETNDYNNKEAVEVAYQEYVSNMDKFRSPTNFVRKIFRDFRLSTEHKRCQAMAELCLKWRRIGRNNDKDEYTEMLYKKINEMYVTTYQSFWSGLSDFFSDISWDSLF